MRSDSSNAMTPSRMPYNVASRSWSRLAISSSSRPKVRRFNRRASSSDAPAPAASATPNHPAYAGSSLHNAAETELSRIPTDTSPTIRPSAA